MNKLHLAVFSMVLFSAIACISFATRNLLMGWVAAIWVVAFMAIYLRARAHGGGEG